MLEAFTVRRKAFREMRKSSLARDDFCAKSGWKPTNLEELRAARQSKTLFILGSGASVCALNKTQWQEIRQCDSFGINFWILHPHVPNYYSFEMPRSAYFRDCLFQNLALRESDYSNTHSIYKVARNEAQDSDELFRSSSLCRSLHATVPSFFTVSDEGQLNYLIRNYPAISRKVRAKNPNALFRKRASIVFATMLAFDLGFKHIVFCGVDGKPGSGYFYSGGSARELFDGAIVPKSTGQKNGALHTTMDPLYNKISLEACLRLIYKELFIPHGLSMSVGTENSKLSEWLPRWNWSA